MSTLKRRDFMKTIGLGATALGSLRTGSFDTQDEPVKCRPNVVFILADDMGWGDVIINNPDSLIPTPYNVTHNSRPL